MKVLVFTPTMETPSGLAMRPETRASIEAQDYGWEWDWEIGTHNPIPAPSHQNVLAQCQRAREIFLAGDWEALLTVEHDMVIPPDAITKLAATPADVVYGVYLLRHGSWVLNAFEYIGGRNLGESLSLYPEKLRWARRTGMVRVSGAGFGCTLMRRPVLEKLAFHKGDDDQWAPDIPFAMDCLHANMVSMARMDVACDHFDGDLRLRPFAGAVGGLMKVEALQTVNVSSLGGVAHLERGQVYDMPPMEARDLVRAGYVREVDSVQSTVNSEEVETAALDGAPEKAVRKQPKRKEQKL